MLSNIKSLADSLYTNVVDYVPILSTFKGCANIVHTIFQKTLQGQESKQIKTHSVASQQTRTYLMLIPVVGNIFLLFLDLIGREKLQDAAQPIIGSVPSHENPLSQPSTSQQQENKVDVPETVQSIQQKPEPKIIIKEMRCEEEDELDKKTNQEKARIENKIPKNLVAAWSEVNGQRLEKSLSNFDDIKKKLKALHDAVLNKKQHVNARAKKCALDTLACLIEQSICILKRRKHKEQVNRSMQKMLLRFEEEGNLHYFTSLLQNGKLDLEELYRANRLGDVAYQAARSGEVDLIKGLIKLGNERRPWPKATTEVANPSNRSATNSMKNFVKFFFEDNGKIIVNPSKATRKIEVFFGNEVISDFLATVVNTDWNIIFPSLISSQSSNKSTAQEPSLTEGERKALRLYASDDFVGINALLRGQFDDLMEELSKKFGYLRSINGIIYYSIALLSGLSKLPPVNLNPNEYLWRGETLYDYPYQDVYYNKLSQTIHNRRYMVMKNRLQIQQENLSERITALTSTSRGRLSCKMRANTISLIKAKLIGRDTSCFSNFPWEREVLIPPTNIRYTYNKILGNRQFFIGKTV